MMKKQIWGWILCVVLMITMLPMSALAADVWDGTADTSWYDAAKTEFTLTTAEQLAGLAQIVNGTTDGIAQDDFTGKTVILGADIDLNNQEWTPISLYKGVFDGNGKTVRNLKITQYADNIGFFGSVERGEVKNLTLDGIDIVLDTDKYPNVGALAGRATFTPVKNCGVRNGTISGSVTMANKYTYVGGLVGNAVADNATKCPIEYCYNYEVVVEVSGGNRLYQGSLVGTNNSQANLCSSFAYVTAQKDDPLEAVGDGYTTYCAWLSSSPDTSDSTRDKQHSEEQFKAGIVTAYLNRYNPSAGKLAWGQELGVDLIPSIGGMPLVEIQTGPNSTDRVYANSELKPGSDGVYIINNAVEWVAFANLVRYNGYSNLDLDARVAKDAVIDFSTIPGWEDGIPSSSVEYLRIGAYINNSQYPYTGTFDGNGCTVKGLNYASTVSDNRGAALFGIVSGTVKNITVEEISLKTSRRGAGIAVCLIGGTLENCHVKSGTITGTSTSYDVSGLVAIASGSGNVIKNCTNGADVSSVRANVGGILGYVSNTSGYAVTIENCHNTGDITSTKECVGGIAGKLNSASKILQCSNTGDVEGLNEVGGIVGDGGSALIKNCYNWGSVTGGDSVYAIGGLIGTSKGYGTGEVINCYNVGTVTGKLCAQPLIGNSASNVAFNASNVTNTHALHGCVVTDHQANYIYYGSDGSNRLTVGKSEADFNGGAVAWLLQNGTDGDVWGQEIGKDKYPVFQGKKIVKITFALADGMTGEAPDAGYTNVGQTLASYPENFGFYSDKAAQNAIDTRTKTYSADTTVYVKITHSWSEAWSSNAEAHWHECKEENCSITENSEKNGYGTHTASADDGDCTTAITCVTCGYVLTKEQAAHNLAYAAEGAVITETCSNNGCSHYATATISAPAGQPIYDGQTAFNASVSYGGNWKAGTLAISYKKDGQATNDTLEAGDYIASIHVDSVTASVSYTVAKASAPQITFPTAGGITYGQKLADAALTGGSTAYGSFVWTNPDDVPEGSATAANVTFTPNAETLKNYNIAPFTQDIAIAITKANTTLTATVDAIEHSATGDDCTVTLSAALSKSGDGNDPTGTVVFKLEDGTELTAAINDGKATCVWTAAQINSVYSITVSYAGDGNYNPSADAVLTVDTNKQQQVSIIIAEPGAKTYGDDPFELSITGGSGEGAVTFTSSDPSILSMSGATATILKPGTVTITVQKAADVNYNSATATITLTIAKKAATVTANSYQIYTGEPVPSPLGYSVDGLVHGDTFSNPTITTVTDTTTAGTYEIRISGGTLSHAECYDVTYLNGTLSVIKGVPPVITSPTQAQVVTVYEGNMATMTVVAENAVSYQWYINRNDGRGYVPINGAISAQYTTSVVKLENDGFRYYCVVTGGRGTQPVTSPIFTLDVLATPVLPQTGDNSHVGLWSLMLMSSMAGVLLILRKRRLGSDN